MSGWGFTDRPAVTVGNAVGRGLIGGTGGKAAVLAALERGAFLPSPHGSGDDYASSTRITIDEAAMLQTFAPAPGASFLPPFDDAAGLVALDLFAGAGGWDVAAERLGIDAHGVELMPEAVATRDANGMKTAFADVWHGLEPDAPDVPPFDLLIASPPCQTFSMAGGGAGRQALDEVLALIASRAFLDVEALRAFGEAHDPRTALVLTPLTYVAKHLPTFVVFEQVPPVLPVWQAMAEVMRAWGYSVAVDVLNAEQYGVPQTRRRAILIARADGVEAAMPTPTHSRYYSRDPQRLDPGVLPWVSMAEALGWGGDERVGFARKADDRGAATPEGYRERDLRESAAPAQAVTEKARSWARMAGAGATAQETSGQRPRETHEPAHTVTGKGTAAWVAERHRGAGMLERGGPRPGRPVEHPAPTVTGNASGTTPGGFRIVEKTTADEVRARVNDQSGSDYDPEWPDGRPALTLAGRDLVPHPGATANRFNGATKSRNDGIRVEPGEAAALQSFPAGMRFEGTKTKVFLQIGNAVPPLLAEAVLRAATRRA